MQKVTIKEYAIKHKLSIFNVMKMVRTGKLKSEEKEEGGKNSIYILLDEKIEKDVQKGIIPIGENTIKEEVAILQDEIKILKSEIEEIKKHIYRD